ncbi:polysaccharide biosynthesis/export family protein [Colwellia psychrerythraea]|uniref:Polysaccharide biosynthesis/export protein n=1 Tax=Colwellia psychrerythraea (strain 34H / ATCC BAA-681) TaxID=167879 RepID=Q47Z31_COLP3|nr:polysaccharide biosynthesis/export family protein [Colwellia psychrerythraea]AAZ27421.1 polysaccharide biosynthesis/export protein [Colwellia psychrerythraea 34H]
MLYHAFNNYKMIPVLVALIAAIVTQGCARHSSENMDKSELRFYGNPTDNGDDFIHEEAPNSVFADGLSCSQFQNMGAALNYRTDKPLNLSSSNMKATAKNDPILAQGLLLSPGDLVEVIIEDGEGFNGRYIVDNAGYVKLPIIGVVEAGGATTNKLETKIELALIRAEIFQPDSASVTIYVLNWSSIEVAVAGAVFQPGTVLINKKPIGIQNAEHLEAYGDYSTTRLLSEAIRAASGIRPDAKLDQIILIRKGWQVQIDMTGMLSGNLVNDYPLVAGDRVIVPSTGCFQAHLVRPSQITPKGFRVFMSNLIDSAGDNSSAGIGRFSTSLPYGTRLLQAAVSANCVGGKEWTNAPRRVVLSSKNPITGETQVIERSVEQLMTMPNKARINPYLMPNDAVACYDSDITNYRDIAKTLTDLIIPFKLL